MAYLGNRPAEAYSAFQKQDFSTSATTSYTLDHPVANQNEIALFINFVRQEPTTAYTASGTSLTLTSATASSDDMYCIYLGKAVQTVNPPSGSVGSSQVAASIITGQTAETSIATDDTVLIHDTSAGALRKMTRANFVSGVGGDNTPAFMAKTSAQQTITSSTETKVQFDTEVVDTDGCYDNSTNYRFTPTTAGKYNVFINMSMETTGGVSTLNNVFVRLHKNGSTIHQSYIDNSNNNGFAALGVVTAIVDMNGSSDYLEAFVRPTASSGNVTVLQVTYTMFGAFKLIGV